jgi:predicted metalloprotease with PDZ domain
MPAAPLERRVRVHVPLGRAGAEGIPIELELTGASGELAELRLASAAHGALGGLQLSDAAGPLPFTAAAHDDAWVVRGERAVRGVLRARYDVESTALGFEDAVATTLGHDRFRLVGETALLLPVAFDPQPISVEVEVDLAALPPGSALASTLGRDRSLRCTGAELRHSAFVAGKLNTARFVTDEATDDWVWLEVLGFDARPVAGETAALRSELARYFERRPPSPFTVLAEASVQLEGSFTLVPRSGGLLLELSVGSSWAGPLRIALARELFRPWFGGEVWMSGAGGAPSARELWFNEGVARALARELVFGFGMLTPDEYADEINGIVGSLVLSPFAGRPRDEVAARAASDGSARRHLAARGAAYATALGTWLRAAGGGSRAFDPVVAQLFQTARSEARALTQADWDAAAAARAGAAAARAFRNIVDAGAPPAFAATGLGPCFRLATRRYAEFALGLDVERSRGRAEGIAELQREGPAARAGLRATDRLVSAHYRENEPAVPAVLEVERSGKQVSIEFLPVGRRVPGPAWVRRSEVPDAACLSN